jgi:hypothetical protein
MIGAAMICFMVGARRPPADNTRSCPITFDYALVASDQTNYTALLQAKNLPTEMITGLGANAPQYDGGDIRFTSDAAGLQGLNCDIVHWAPSTVPSLSLVQIWVRIPLLSAEAPGTTIYVWYHSTSTQTQPAASDPVWGRYGVYDSNYLAVWHLENSAGIDSTSNQNTLTPYSPSGPGCYPQYYLGAFDGSSGAYFDDFSSEGTPGVASLRCPVIGIPNSVYTIEALQWANGYIDFPFDTVTNYYNGQAQYSVGMYYWNRFSFGPVNSAPTSWPITEMPTGGSYDYWQTTDYLGGPFGWDSYFYSNDGLGNSNSAVYAMNGVQEASPVFTNPGAPTNVATSSLQYTSIGGGYSNFFNGIMDEVRISNIVRTPGYATTIANNMWQFVYYSQFATAGTPS